MRIVGFLLLPLLFAVAACGEGQDGPGDAGLPATGDATGAGPAQGAAGAGGSAALMAEMHGHLAMMEAAGGDEIMPVLSRHSGMVTELIARMEAERRASGTGAGDAWSATADSVRQDLARMSTMDPGELEEVMPAHLGRITRLMSMHEATAP